MLVITPRDVTVRLRFPWVPPSTLSSSSSVWSPSLCLIRSFDLPSALSLVSLYYSVESAQPPCVIQYGRICNTGRSTRGTAALEFVRIETSQLSPVKPFARPESRYRLSLTHERDNLHQRLHTRAALPLESFRRANAQIFKYWKPRTPWSAEGEREEPCLP